MRPITTSIISRTMYPSFEQSCLVFEQWVQNLKSQIASPIQDPQIDIQCPPRQNREQHYGYRIDQSFIVAFENEIKKFIDPADFYDPSCASFNSLTRNWILKELRLHQLDYKCCVDPALELEDSVHEDSEGEVEGIVDEKEDDAKTGEGEGGVIGYEDTKEDETKADEDVGDTYDHEDEKDDDTKTDEDQGDTTHYENEKDDDPKTDENQGDTTRYEDEKDDDTKTDEDQGDTTHYEDEKEDDTKTDKEEANTHDHEDTKEDNTKTDEESSSPYEDEKEDEDEGYTSHGDGDQTEFNEADDELELENECKYDSVVVVISVCSDNPVSFQARPTQAQMDMMTTLLAQPPQWWVSYRDIY
ncbi:hypothetical protein DEU56DRAFT_836684 [Suillus clintonianus]|uniref:uncharacterized protein n=1 Tax=Suillus clintonianus TaxID=1904413 RepID=UPI001B87B582|nr:uncharacterized protein DEU56DRAFT_836684 [Suillus clintonianus]KAG2119328.1 hypothetical protein DEU56DRAFT_836684 [Suillus clintonianus]